MFNSTVGIQAFVGAWRCIRLKSTSQLLSSLSSLGLLGFSNIQFLPKRISASISHPTSKVGIDWTIWKFLSSILISAIFFHLCAIVLSTSISPTEGAYHWDYLITWSIRRRVSEKSFVICPKRVLFRLVVMEIRWRDRNMNERVCKINTASVRSPPDNKLPSDSASDWVIGAGRLFSRFSIVEL